MIALRDLDVACDAAAAWAQDALSSAGLRVMRTFDLQGTLPPASAHPAAPDDCQMVVLLVYAGSQPPACLVITGAGGHAWLALSDDANRHPAGELERKIQSIITA